MRFPLALAYSQFLYCKFVLRRKKRDFPKRSRGEPRAPSGGLREWTSHFPSNESAFSCYDPTDMQYRFVAGSGSSRRARGVASATTLEKAVSILDAAFYFVGVVDLYDESLCLFEYALTNVVPSHCGCGRTPPKRRKTHAKMKRLRNATVDSLSPGDRRDLARITSRDLALYARALVNLEARVTDVAARTGVSLACAASLDAAFEAALEWACFGEFGTYTATRVLEGSGRRCPSRGGRR